MPDSLEIEPLERAPHAVVRPPGSKSITNRALICAALAEGESLLEGALDSDDTRVMIAALAGLGIDVRPHENPRSIQVGGCGGKIPVTSADLYVANSGTTARFLTAVLALGHGTYRLDGTPRMRERPIQDLLDSLRQLGVDARSEAGTGCPPVIVEARGLKGGRTTIRGDVSSQFLSGLLMAAPYATAGIELSIVGELVSQPYIGMTLAVMDAFGVPLEKLAREHDRFTAIRLPGQQHYQGRRYAIEPDASAASYFWGAAAICRGRVAVAGLSRASLQGDVGFCQCLEEMGCRVEYEANQITVHGRPLHGIDVNMNAISDTVQTLAAVALFAAGPTTVRGVEHIRHKETDRLAALAIELRKLGAQVLERADGLTIVPPIRLHGAQIDTYDDHRMAMSLALVGLRVPGVIINDPGCTAKTYPAFFQDLKLLRAGSSQ